MNRTSADKRQELAEYQADLLDVFYESSSGAQAAERLLEIERKFSSILAPCAFDPRMIDLATHLTKKWGNKKT